MPKPFETWTVLPHKPLQKLEDNLWVVQGSIDFVRRRMVIVRMSGNRLLIWNGIALDEPEMKEIEAWGTPTFLVVPNGLHRMDARIYKQRYPGLTVIAPAGAKKKVEQVVAVDRTDGNLGDASVTLTFPACTAEREALLEVKHAGGGVTFVINDLVMNSRNGKGPRGLLLRLLGLTADTPNVPFLTRALLVKDKPGLKTLLQQLAATPELRRVILSHGENLESGAADGLRQALQTF